MLKAVFLNAGKLDFNHNLDFSRLAALTTYTSYEGSASEEILGRVAGQEVVITKELPLPASLLEAFPPSVRLICEAGTGYNNIDLAAARAKGIAVCNIPSYSSEAVAQLAITFILNLSISFPQQLRMQVQGRFENFTDHVQVPLRELRGQTLGLVGCGAIAQATARLAQALGMEVLVHSRSPKPELGLAFAGLDEVLRSADFLSLHCPLSAETRHLIKRESLALMKPTAFLINTSRGGLVLEADLVQALREGSIAGAGLDVQDPEPPSTEHPLFSMPNVILTPHIGWRRRETRQRLIDLVVENIAGFERGQALHIVSA